MNCAHCGNSCGNKSWMMIRTQSDDVHHLCSYICYNTSRSNYPPRLTEVLNRGDFNYLFPNIEPPREIKFQFLNHEDLLQMSENEICAYYDHLDMTVMNPVEYEVHLEQEENDRRTREIEEEFYLSSEEDDY
jgi:hypothetical protein